MTIQQQIESLQNLIREQLQAHEQFFDSWNNADWHQRTTSLHLLLHGMWQVYEEAEYKMSLLNSIFPPYPFSEISKIRNWLRQSIHRVEDFLSDDYHPTESSEYLESYKTFLSHLCDDVQVEFFHHSEKLLVESERNLLNMLLCSYSVLLDLLLRSYNTISNDDKQILISYINCRTRYERLTWPKQKKLFEARLKSRYPWDNLPNSVQLQEEYTTIHRAMSETTIGHLFIEHANETEFAVALAKSNVSEEDLAQFFLSSYQLAYLSECIENLRQAADASPSYCTYIVPGTDKTRDEIEADLANASRQSAAKFREFLHNYRVNGYLDFRHEVPAQIYTYLHARYNLPYDMGNFTRNWNV